MWALRHPRNFSTGRKNELMGYLFLAVFMSEVLPEFRGAAPVAVSLDGGATARLSSDQNISNKENYPMFSSFSKT